MALNFQEVREFVRNYGAVTAYTTSGRMALLHDGEPTAVGMVELWADILEFDRNQVHPHAIRAAPLWAES